MVTVYPSSPVYIPHDLSIERIAPAGTNENNEPFDRRTLFYDLVPSADSKTLHCIGPPFLNIGPPLSVFSRGKKLLFSVYQPLNLRTTRVAITSIRVPRLAVDDDVELRFEFSDFDLRYQFALRKHHLLNDVEIVMSTLQKDNDPQWIKDWCTWHYRVHSVRRIVIYDNGSDAFDQLREALDELTGPEIFLVPWNHTYGSFALKFPQTTALNHCRLLFARGSNWCINLDIDEYLYNGTGFDLSAVLRRSAFRRDAVVYLRHYLVPFLVDGVPPRCFDSNVRFHSLRSQDKKYLYQPCKTLLNEVHSALEMHRPWWVGMWRRVIRLGAIALGRVPRIKSIVLGMVLGVSSRDYHRYLRGNGVSSGDLEADDTSREDGLFFFHFRALNTGWKIARQIHRIDDADVVVDPRIGQMKSALLGE